MSLALGGTITPWNTSANESSSNSITTGAITGATITAGNLVVIFIAIDNISTTDGQTNDVTSMTDSGGASNVYIKAGEFTNTVGGVAGDGACVAVFYCVLVNDLTISTTTLTVNFSANVVAKVIGARWFTKSATSQIYVHPNSLQTLANDNSDAGAMTINNTSAKHEYLFFRAIASETDTATASSNTTSYSAANVGPSGTGGSEKNHVSIQAEFRITSSASETSDPTMTDTTADRASVFFALVEFEPTDVVAQRPQEQPYFSQPRIAADGEQKGVFY